MKVIVLEDTLNALNKLGVNEQDVVGQILVNSKPFQTEVGNYVVLNEGFEPIM